MGHPGVYPKLRSPSTLMPTVSSTYPLSTNLLVNKKKSLSQTTRDVCPRKTSKRWWLMPRNSRLRMKNSRIKLLKMIRRPSWTNAMKLLLGLMPIKPLRRMNTKINKRRLKVSATPSSLSCTKPLEVPLGVCLEVCQVLVDPGVCLVQEDPEPEVDPPSKKSTKKLTNFKTDFPPFFVSPDHQI